MVQRLQHRDVVEKSHEPALDDLRFQVFAPVRYVPVTLTRVPGEKITAHIISLAFICLTGYKQNTKVKTQPKKINMEQSFDMDGARKKKHLFEFFEILPKEPVRVIGFLDTKLHDTVFKYALNVMLFYIDFALP